MNLQVYIQKQWPWLRDAVVVAGLIYGIMLFTTDAEPIHWWGATAAFFVFLHFQATDYLAAYQSAMKKNVDLVPPVCADTILKIHIVKELLWSVYFIWIGNYSAIAISVVVIVLPFYWQWRRNRHPIQ